MENQEFNTSTGELEDKIGCEDWRELIGDKKNPTMNQGHIDKHTFPFLYKLGLNLGMPPLVYSLMEIGRAHV